MHHGSDLGRNQHIGAAVEAGDTEIRFDGAALLLDGIGIAKAVDHDIGALLGERARDGEADSAGGAGDDGIAGLQHMGLLAGFGGQPYCIAQ